MTDIRVKILVFQHDGTVVSQYLLGEGVHIIGRDPNSAIYVESEYISNEHAKLHLTDEGIFIEDLNSTSGTFLDDVTVRGKLRLNPDQRLKVGDLYIDLQLEAAGDLAPGVKIGAGRYQLVKELGRGAMGQVWLGQDTQLDEYVAIKVLNSDVAKDAVSLLDLKREVQKSRKLSHDNIIRIHDLVQLPGENPFISLEYVEGTDLHAIQLNQPDRIFQWAEVKPYVLQLCEALDYAHERKIVHRDLKPPNIMIAKDGVLKLADFGIAASITDATGRSSMANIISGTPQFMSPQQMLGKSPKASDDIYALGATIYDLLTGRPPFHTGDIAQQVHHVTPAPIEQRLAEFGLQNPVPDYVNSVVLSCLAKDPEARPTSAGAIAEWIRTEGKSDSPAKRKKTKTGVEKITPEEPIQAEAESPAPVEAQPQPAKAKKTPVLAIAAVAVIAVILGVLFLGKSGGKDENQNQGNGSQAGGKGGTEGQPAISAQMQAKLNEGLVAYYPFNGNANDESGNGRDGDVKGPTLTVDRHGNNNRAFEFNGEDDSVHLPAFKYGSQFTISIWANSDGYPRLQVFFSKKPSFHVDSLALSANQGDGRYRAMVHSGNDISIGRYAPNPGPITGVWSHIIFTYDGGGTSSAIKIYKDGIRIDDAEAPTEKGTFTTFNDLDVISEIGSHNGGSTTFDGKLDDIRIYNRALSADEITALYDLEKPDYTKILKQGLVAYYPFNGNAKDESGNGHDGKVTGATPATDRHGKANSAYAFPSKDDFISVPEAPGFEGNAHTISMWFNSSATKALSQGTVFICKDNNPQRQWQVAEISNRRIKAIVWTSEGMKTIDSKAQYNIGQWHHLTQTWDGKKLGLYVDGRLDAEVPAVGPLAAGDQPILIGAQGGYAFKGSLDDIRFYNRALSAGEVAALYDLEKPSSETASGTKKPGTVLWEFETGSSMYKGPAIGTDGTVYIGSNDKKVYALDGTTGAKKWEFHAIAGFESSPAISAGGTVYIGCHDNKIYALDGKSGTKKWEFVTGGYVRSSLAIGSDGTVYFVSHDKKVYALDGASGTKKWEFETGGKMVSSPAIGSYGTIYVGSEDKKVYALDGASGTKKWEFVTGGYVQSSPAIGSDGTIYVGSEDKKVYALDGASGTKKWEFETGGKMVSSPAIGSDGTVYVGSEDKKVYALDGASGAKKWEFKTGSWVHSSPAIGSDGTVYVGSDDKKVYALDGQTGARKWEFETGFGVRSSPTIGANGIVYIGSRDRKVYALASSSKGPAKSPWPMRGQNARHTGRASATTNSPEAAIRKAAGKPTGELTKADLEKVKRLLFYGGNLTDLTPLSGLTNLDSLNVSSNQITDLAPLIGMLRLRGLDLHSNQITDPTPLKGLKNVNVLDLSDNRISDLTPLAELDGLSVLLIGSNRITKLTPLKARTDLTSVNFANNQVLDLLPLSGLKKLKYLNFNNNQVSDLTPLTGLLMLKEIQLKDNPDLTKAQIAELQKALPKCRITSNPTK